MERKTVLEARSLRKQVTSPEGMLTILDDVNLAVGAGESVAVVGASGAGKSTLLALLAGLDEPSAGSVWLDGIELSALDEDGRAAVRARQVGFVFQSFHLVPRLTAAENVELPMTFAGIPRAERRERVRAGLAAVGLSTRADHQPSQLSGGERQRVAIARATILRPRLVLADEPTGNLDTRTAAEMFELLRRVNESGTTILYVTHDPALAALAGRIVTIRDGRVVTG
jgi:putative ABC transport system ATP-binding protein